MNCNRLERELAEHGAQAGRVAHLLECESCRSLWVSGRMLREGRPTSGGSRSCRHADRVAALADGTLAGEERSAALEHVSTCEACRNGLVGMLEDLDRLENLELSAVPEHLERRALRLAPDPGAAPGSGAARWTVRVAAAAGIAFLGLGLGLLWLDRAEPMRRGAGSSALRTAEAGAPRPLEPQGRVESATGLRFAWKDEPGAAERRYRLVVMELERGETVLRIVTDGTSHVLTAEQAARLRPGVRYHWLVEPLSGVGVAPSETRSFELAR